MNLKKIILSLIILVLLVSDSLVYSQYCTSKNWNNYKPDMYTPIKTVRINFWFMRKNDGSGSFDFTNPEHVKFVNDMMTLLNQRFSTLNTFVGTSCYDSSNIADSRIRFSLENIFTHNDTYLWNNENEGSVYGCPGSDWYLNNFNENYASAATGNDVALNIYFTENECNYNDLVLNQSTCPNSLSGVLCSQFPSSNIAFNSAISMRNVFVKFYTMKHDIAGSSTYPGSYWDNTTVYGDGNVYGWMVGGTASGLAHELGHSLGWYHETNCESLMNGSGSAPRTYICPNQLAHGHYNLTNSNLQKYVKEDNCTYDANHSITIPSGQHVVWNTSRKIKGNLYIGNGATLTIKSKVVFAGGASVILSPYSVLNIEGQEAKFVANCCSASKSLSFTVNPYAQVNVSNYATLHLDANTNYNVMMYGKIDIKSTAFLCREDNANFVIQSGGSVSLHDSPINDTYTSSNISVNGTVNSGDIKASNSIVVSNATINLSIVPVEYKAGNFITISPNTSIVPGTKYFRGYVHGVGESCQFSEDCVSNLKAAVSNHDHDKSNEGGHTISCNNHFDLLPQKKEVVIAEVDELYQNEPNPLDYETVIRYKLTEKGPVTIVLSDAFGKELIKLVDNENHSKGTFSVVLNSENLHAGVYYYTLYSAKGNITRRLFIVK